MSAIRDTLIPIESYYLNSNAIIRYIFGYMFIYCTSLFDIFLCYLTFSYLLAINLYIY